MQGAATCRGEDHAIGVAERDVPRPLRAVRGLVARTQIDVPGRVVGVRWRGAGVHQWVGGQVLGDDPVGQVRVDVPAKQGGVRVGCVHEQLVGGVGRGVQFAEDGEEVAPTQRLGVRGGEHQVRTVPAGRGPAWCLSGERRADRRGQFGRAAPHPAFAHGELEQRGPAARQLSPGGSGGPVPVGEGGPQPLQQQRQRVASGTGIGGQDVVSQLEVGLRDPYRQPTRAVQQQAQRWRQRRHEPAAQRGRELGHAVLVGDRPPGVELSLAALRRYVRDSGEHRTD